MGRENGNPFENSSYNITGIAGGKAVTFQLLRVEEAFKISSRSSDANRLIENVTVG